MIEIYKNKLMEIYGWSSEDFDFFNECYERSLNTVRGRDTKYYLYTEEYIEDVLALIVTVEKDIKNIRVFTTACLLNGMFNDLDNFQGVSVEFRKYYKVLFKYLKKHNLFTSQEEFYILNFLFHVGHKLPSLHFEDMHSDFLLFEDIRNFFMLVKVNEYICRLSNDYDECSTNYKGYIFPAEKFIKQTSIIKKNINHQDIKDLYQVRINVFFSSLKEKFQC